MSATADDVPESGALPGRFEFVREPSFFGIPTDPSWNRFSDVIRSFNADPGANLNRQDNVGNPDAEDHNRGTEDPSLSIGYDLQQFPTDGAGAPVDASGDGVLRDSENQLPNSHLVVERQELPGGNDGAGVRTYTVGRGCYVQMLEATLDPSGGNPILMELDYQPKKVRSYRIDQLSNASTLDLVSTSDNDTFDVTIENEDASLNEDVTLSGTTTVTSTESFANPDVIWCNAVPEGDITVTDGSGTTLMTIDGGDTYSEDNNPVDGDRGIPPLGTGSHASAIGSSYEHFIGDRFERPSGSDVRARVNSASWAVENEISTDSDDGSYQPVVAIGGRTVTVDADVAGPYVSHDSMMEALTKVQNNLEHELDGGTITFNNTVPQDNAERERQNDQAVASYSETLAASGDPAISFSTP